MIFLFVEQFEAQMNVSAGREFDCIAHQIDQYLSCLLYTSRCVYETALEVQVNFQSRGIWMDISEFSKKTGVPSCALRDIAKMGLTSSVPEKGKRHRTAATVLDQLTLLALGQAAGLAFDVIRPML